VEADRLVGRAQLGHWAICGFDPSCSATRSEVGRRTLTSPSASRRQQIMLAVACATLPDLPEYRTGVILVGIARYVLHCIRTVAWDSNQRHAFPADALPW
jgi:hypothetical protein